MSRGFTLIELLVVIAIIGMLSSVVLGSLNSSRGKAANAAVKSNMSNMRSQINLQFEDGPFTSICSNSSPIFKFRTAAAQAGGGAAGGNANICNNNAPQTQYAISIELKVPENGNNYWCLDYLGAFKGHVNAIAGGASVCP